MDNEYESPWGLSQLEAPTDSQQPESQALNDDELGINTEVQVKRTRYVAKLDDTRLLGEKGLGALKHLCSKVNLKGNGHEVGDLGRLLEMYQLWSHDLFPKGQFKNLYPLTSKAGRTANVRSLRLAWIDEEQRSKNTAELAATVDELEDITDFRDRGRHFDTEPRYSRQSEPSRFDSEAPVDNPDDLFVGMDSVDHRLVSDEDVDIQAEVSRREEDNEQDVSELLEGARAQRDEDNSRSSGRVSLFDLGDNSSASPVEGDIFGTGALEVPAKTSTPPSTQAPAKASTPPSTQAAQPPSTQPPSTQPPSTQPPSTQAAQATQAPATQPPSTMRRMDDLELDMLADFEPDLEDQEQEPEPEDYEDDEEMAVLREMGM
ncbi:Chromosome segregation in meiosis protein 3 [Yarrowia sp. B02]|nr:Chromosome segregation in meiosis protein 3 [Yarrowia sp. B02]